MNGLPQENFRRLFPLLFPFLALWLLFWVIPLFLGVDLALQNPDSGFANSENSEIEYVGLENFQRIISDPKFHKALFNTLMRKKLN